MIRWAQQTLDELFESGQIPFKLTAHTVEPKGYDKYTVGLFDSRVHSVTVFWEVGMSFKDLVRTALMDRISNDNRPDVQSATRVA